MSEGITGAVAVAVNRVRVTLTTAPIVTGPYSANLAANWLVFTYPAATSVPVIAAAWRADIQAAELTIKGRWVAGIQYLVNTANVRAADGILAFTTPNTWLFDTLIQAAKPAGSVRRQAGLDFRLQALGDAKTPAGCYAVEGGDYALWAGPAARESDILRRLQTPRGGFAHLAEYGVGLQPKKLLSVQAMLTAKVEIVKQVKREPNVRAASATITRQGRNVITVTVRAETTEGGTIEAADTLQG